MDDSPVGKAFYAKANRITVSDGHLMVCRGTDVVAIHKPGQWKVATVKE